MIPDYYDDDDFIDPQAEYISECRSYVKEVLKHLYSNDPLDKFELEDCIEDLCKHLSIRLPDNFLNIDRRKSNYFSNFDIKSLYVTKTTI